MVFEKEDQLLIEPQDALKQIEAVVVLLLVFTCIFCWARKIKDIFGRKF